ncbi:MULTISPECIES: hypothetical protein [Burkholderia]|uniref:hypothetical protein n=1 Tax=Burkholderia TaxID=32008 RepID=UPI000F5C8D53|nr:MULTISPECIES: hypothetical protein [Burkholderia]MDD1493991.1 hypothetical protein [Burkholderia thailandensis]
MKVSATLNAALWGILSVVAFAGVPVTILRPGPLGLLPIVGSLLVGMITAKSAYRQWREQKIQIDFLKTFPMLALGFGGAVLLSYLAK